MAAHAYVSSYHKRVQSGDSLAFRLQSLVLQLQRLPPIQSRHSSVAAML